MSNKFSGIPNDTDTTIIAQYESCLSNYDVFYQKWRWDGITAESFIFADNDVTSLSDNDIDLLVRSSKYFNVNSTTTIKRTESGFVFVNFNFEIN
jgi:hypothetical protein